jgi:hypothetical protein
MARRAQRCSATGRRPSAVPARNDFLLFHTFSRSGRLALGQAAAVAPVDEFFYANKGVASF